MKKKRLTIYLPRHLVDQIERRLWDNLLNRSRYGAKTRLIQSLIEQWLGGVHDPGSATGTARHSRQNPARRTAND
jgi:hypothetical protein